MSMDARNEKVAAAIWPWRDREQDGAVAEDRRRVRKALKQAAVTLGAAAVFFVLHWYRMSIVAAVIAAVVCVSGTLIPPLFNLLDGLVTATTRIVGGFFTWLLLVPFFCLVFVPARLILMLKGKDPMTRKCPSAETTYWVPRPARRPDHFARQY